MRPSQGLDTGSIPVSRSKKFYMDQTRKFYEKNTEMWSVARNYAFFLEPQFKSLLKHLKTGDSVIDLGCAAANHVPLFLGIGRHLKYTGADISNSMLKVAHTRYPQLDFRNIDLSDPKTFPKRKYHGFWAVAVMMHVPIEKWPAMIENITRLIKPGGYGFLTLPEKRPNKRSYHDQRHFTLLKPNQFKKIAGNYGWKVVSRGHFVSTNNKTPWNWFMVKIPWTCNKK